MGGDGSYKLVSSESDVLLFVKNDFSFVIFRL